MMTQEKIPYTQEEIKAMVKTIGQLRKEKKELIDKACAWLEREYAYNGSMSVLNNELIEAFRKAMED